VEDVQNAVRWARQEGVPLRARSGGHSYEAYSTLDDGLIIDVGGLDLVEVDVARGEAAVGAGVRLLDLYQRLWERGVTLPGGTCPSVGIAGLTLGGGVGYVSRQYGLTCDNLLALEMVDAEGDVLRASAEEHGDLFWASRGGGGGNFGIVTSFTFRVHPISDVAVYTVTWPWEAVGEALDVWQRWAPAVDERLTAGFVVPDTSAGVVVSTGQFNGAPAELERLIAPLLQSGGQISQQVRSIPFRQAVDEFGGEPFPHSTFKNTGAFVYEPWSEAAIATFVEQMRASPTTANVVGFFPWGGAIAAVDAAATAVVHRSALYDVQYQAYWHDPAEEEADVAWVRDIRTAMLPYTLGTYVNYIDDDIADWAEAYYGANFSRLVEVKRAYDPEDVFNGPQSVPARLP
jgi:FAD/FMN-containing dehydrogenase